MDGVVDGPQFDRHSDRVSSPRRERDWAAWPQGEARIPSRFELIAQRAQREKLRRTTELLMMVLGGQPNQLNPACEALQPIWAHEVVHRAFSLVKLLAPLENQARIGARDPSSRQIETGLASELGGLYRSLEALPEKEIVSCSEVLRELVSNLVALFGCAAGDVDLRTDITRLALPVYKRRALVLAASELVINALTHAFTSRRHGRIIVSLHAIYSQRARLVVADDGLGCEMSDAEAEHGMAGMLSDLLEGTLTYGRFNRAGTVAVINFPTRLS